MSDVQQRVIGLCCRLFDPSARFRVSTGFAEEEMDENLPGADGTCRRRIEYRRKADDRFLDRGRWIGGPDWLSFAVTDGMLAIGRSPSSSEATAQAVLALLFDGGTKLRDLRWFARADGRMPPCSVWEQILFVEVLYGAAASHARADATTLSQRRSKMTPQTLVIWLVIGG